MASSSSPQPASATLAKNPLPPLSSVLPPPYRVPEEQEKPDARASLRHILADDPQDAPATPKSYILPPPSPTALVAADPAQQHALSQSANASDSTPGSPDGEGPSSAAKPNYSANPTTTRRNANGSVSSVYSGNKIRHLKKDDGVPLWRKDIQYDFLKYVFEDDKAVFHKASDGSSGHTFADIYLDAMAKSSKCSKILKDKLLSERPAALNMAMVCLLVNVGRMNTTLNFFPEMRAQLRTYHSIPSLQAHQDPNAYKQLQDAPRLKSILKGATEDVEQPSTLEDIRAASIPRTNPVNLIFVLSQHAPKISEMHFDVPRDFFDLVMKPSLSSRSRATAFLWLMWWYLESDFSSDQALVNPYGPGRKAHVADDREMPIKCPQFDILTDEQAALENVDTEEEKEFGEQKRKERVAILQTDMAPVITGPKRTSKKAAYNTGVGVFSMASDNDGASPARDYDSPAPSGKGIKSMPPPSSKDEQYDSDQTRSASPTGSFVAINAPPQKPVASGMRIRTLLNDEAPTPPPSAPPKGPGRGNWGPRKKAGEASASAVAALEAAMKEKLNREAEKLDKDSDGPLAHILTAKPHGYYIPLNGQLVEPKRSRPLTLHQRNVEKYRMENVSYILDRGLREAHVKAKKRRVKESMASRAWKRCRALPDMWDSEEEAAAATQGSGVATEGIGSRDLMAARALVMMASLKQSQWETPDWGEEAAHLASGIRKVRRRSDRWESGGVVVKRRNRVADATASSAVEKGLKKEDMYDDEDVDMDDGDGDGDVIERSSLPERDEADDLDDDEGMDEDGE